MKEPYCGGRGGDFRALVSIDNLDFDYLVLHMIC